MRVGTDSLEVPQSPVISGTEPASGSFRAIVEQAASRIVRDQRALDDLVAHNHAVSNGELLLLQVRVYRFSQEVELGTKLVDRFAQTVRQTMTSQS